MIHTAKRRKLFCSFNNSCIYLYEIKFIALQRTGDGEENNLSQILPVKDFFNKEEEREGDSLVGWFCFSVSFIYGTDLTLSAVIFHAKVDELPWCQPNLLIKCKQFCK